MPELEPNPCERTQVLLDADSAIQSVFFPHSGVVSVMSVYEDGSVIETATIGREGCTAFYRQNMPPCTRLCRGGRQAARNLRMWSGLES